MKWELGDSNDGWRQLRIEAPWEELADDYRDLLDSYAKVKLPGFRPGKVPRAVLEQRFGREIFDALGRRGAERLGRQALREAEIEAAGALEISEIACIKEEPLRCTGRFIPFPAFALPDYRALAVRKDAEAPLDELSRLLLESTPFAVPAPLVRSELAVDGNADDEPGSDAWRAAEERVRMMLILKKIARTEGIEVDERDVERRIAAKAREFETTPAQLKAELEQGGGYLRLRDLLLAESTLEYLLGRITY